jgi:hypothetical protein
MSQVSQVKTTLYSGNEPVTPGKGAVSAVVGPRDNAASVRGGGGGDAVGGVIAVRVLKVNDEGWDE